MSPRKRSSLFIPVHAVYGSDFKTSVQEAKSLAGELWLQIALTFNGNLYFISGETNVDELVAKYEKDREHYAAQNRLDIQ